MANDRPKLQLSGPQIIGGALAAASAAVAASWLGVAGTVLGAVIVSLVASVGSAFYTHSLERSSHVIRETLPVLPQRVSGAGTTTAVLPATADDDEAGSESVLSRGGTTEQGSVPERSAGRGVSWPTILVSAAATLALAVAVLTGFEALTGRPASSITGANNHDGTTLSQLVGDDEASSTADDPEQVDEPASPTTGQGTDPSPKHGSQQSPVDSAGTSSTPTEPTPTGSEPTSSEPTQIAPTHSEPTPSTPTDVQPTD